MAKIKNLDAIRRNVERKIKSFKNDPAEIGRAATTIQSQLRINLRAGKLEDGEEFPTIEQSTIAKRKALAGVNKTSKYYGANKSNATFTGDLIQKIFAKAKGLKIELFGSGSHKKLKGVRGKTLKGSDASISDIIGGFKDRGVKLLYVPNSAKGIIRKQFLRFLRRKQ